MTRQTGGFEYELKYSQCRRLSWRYYHGQFRVYAPEGTSAEEADEYARRHYLSVRLTAAFEKRASETRWPKQWTGRRTY